MNQPRMTYCFDIFTKFCQALNAETSSTKFQINGIESIFSVPFDEINKYKITIEVYKEKEVK